MYRRNEDEGPEQAGQHTGMKERAVLTVPVRRRPPALLPQTEGGKVRRIFG